MLRHFQTRRRFDIRISRSDGERVILDIGIAVGRNGSGITGIVRIQAVGRFPLVGDTVAVAVERFVTAIERAGTAMGQVFLGTDTVGRTFRAERREFVYQILVDLVAHRQARAHAVDNPMKRLLGRHHVHNRRVRFGPRGNAVERFQVIYTRTARRRIFGLGHFTTVGHAVLVGIVIVAGSIILEVGITPGKRSRSVPRTFHEIVVLDVSPRRPFAVAHDVATATSPVVNDIVDKLVKPLDFGITGLVFDIEVAIEGNTAFGLYQSAAGVRLQTLTDDGILYRDVARHRTLVVPTYREAFVASP